MRRLLFAAFFILLLPCLALADGGYIEVRASGRGNSRTEALANAIDEALRANVGTLFMSREEIADDVMRDKVIQFSRGLVKDTRIVSEKTENGEILITALIQIDADKLKEEARNFRRASSGDVVIKQRTSLEHGAKVIGSFFREADLLSFIDTEIEDRKIDPAKGEFSLLVRIMFSRDKYFGHFVPALSSILDGSLLSSDIFPELYGGDPKENHRAVIYVLGENMTFRGWTIPGAFFEAVKDALSLEDFDGRTVLRTQKRIWLNIALIDSSGRELSLQRIPVPLPVTNILFFSLLPSNNPNPYFLGIKTQWQIPIVCAPFFGISSKNGAYYEQLFSGRNEPLEQHFVFHLPGEILSRVKSLELWLNLEK